MLALNNFFEKRLILFSGAPPELLRRGPQSSRGYLPPIDRGYLPPAGPARGGGFSDTQEINFPK